MKQFLLPVFLIWSAFCPQLPAADTPPAPATSSDVAAPQSTSPVFTGEFVPPTPRRPMPAVPEADVVRRSSIATGGRTITMEELVPLEEPPVVVQAAAPKLTPEETAARQAAWLEQRRAHPVVTLFLSGTVYDHKTTLLRWRHGGADYQAWSNLDFNVMQNVPTVQVGNTSYHLLMMFWDATTTPRVTSSGSVITPAIPKIPKLPEEPGFVVVAGDPANEAAMLCIGKLHELYAADREQLDAAYERRRRYQAAAQAWAKDNPPQPENVTIRWWRGKRDPKPVSSVEPEGGQP